MHIYLGAGINFSWPGIKSGKNMLSPLWDHDRIKICITGKRNIEDGAQ